MLQFLFHSTWKLPKQFLLYFDLLISDVKLQIIKVVFLNLFQSCLWTKGHRPTCLASPRSEPTSTFRGRKISKTFRPMPKAWPFIPMELCPSRAWPTTRPASTCAPSLPSWAPTAEGGFSRPLSGKADHFTLEEHLWSLLIFLGFVVWKMWSFYFTWNTFIKDGIIIQTGKET